MRYFPLIISFIILIPLISCEDVLNDDIDRDRIIIPINDTLILRDTIQENIIVVDTIIINDNEVRDTIRDTVLISDIREFIQAEIIDGPYFSEFFTLEIESGDSTILIEKEDRWFQPGRSDSITFDVKVDISGDVPNIDIIMILLRDPEMDQFIERKEWINSMNIEADMINLYSGVLLSDNISAYPKRFFDLTTISKDAMIFQKQRDDVKFTIDCYDSELVLNSYYVNIEFEGEIEPDLNVSPITIKGNIVIKFNDPE